MDLLPPILDRILRETPALAQAYLVGGCVRDGLLGLEPKDFDIEVYGLSYEALEEALRRWGRTDLVGRSFGVVKLSVAGGQTYDFSVPRRDSKSAAGHRGFEIRFDPGITIEEAARRRDFTINAMFYDPRTRAIVDPCGGRVDLERRILRHTSEHFSDDPLRVLRGMQFAARFAMTPNRDTLALCRQIKGTFGELAIERVREEWLKWAGQSTLPSAGLRFLDDTGWIDHFPELRELTGTPQDPEWHPEGDVFTHTCHACDALVSLREWQDADLATRQVLLLAVLVHDLAKAATTRSEIVHGKRRLVSPGHEALAGAFAERFFARISLPRSLQERVLPLASQHMVHLQPATERSVRRLAVRLCPETIDHLALVIRADHHGRPPRPRESPPGLDRILELARLLALQQQAPKPLLQGRHLQALGCAPGPRFGVVLKAAFEAQLDGQFADLNGAKVWLTEYLAQAHGLGEPPHPSSAEPCSAVIRKAETGGGAPESAAGHPSKEP